MARTDLVGGGGVMVYLDDVPVVGRGKLNSRKQMAFLLLHLCSESCVNHVKCTLEPTHRLVWLGTVVDLDTHCGCGMGVSCGTPVAVGGKALQPTHVVVVHR